MADGEALYMIEWTGTDACRVTKVRTSDFHVVNQWYLNQSNRAIAGTYDRAHNVFWLGKLDTAGTIYRYKGPGLDLRDNPIPLPEDVRHDLR